MFLCESLRRNRCETYYRVTTNITNMFRVNQTNNKNHRLRSRCSQWSVPCRLTIFAVAVFIVTFAMRFTIRQWRLSNSTLLFEASSLQSLHQTGLISSSYWTDESCRSSSSCRANARALSRWHQLMMNYRHNAIPKIPWIFHQTWKSEIVPAIHDESSYAKWISSWTYNHPSWRYMFWTDETSRRLIVDALPIKYLLAYDALYNSIAKADFSRYVMLFVFGGVYVDIDFESISPLTNITYDYDAFVGTEPLIHSRILYGSSMQMCNAIMGSRKHHPFWMQILDEIVSSVDNDVYSCNRNPVSCTGPGLVHKTYNSETGQNLMAQPHNSVSVMDPNVFYPEIAEWAIPTMKERCRDATPNMQEGCDLLNELKLGESRTSKTLAEHHWKCSWCRTLKFEYAHINTIVPPESLELPFDDVIEFQF